ncbi:MAG: hypothetical protein RSP_04830 [Rhodanobacter sp.]
MSTDWSNAFGGGGSKEVPARRPEVTSPSQGREEVGLLSDEAAAELRAKASEAGKRLADGFGMGAARTADVAGRLGGQGAHHARAFITRLRQERVGHNAKVLCGAIIGLALLAVGGIEWHAHRSIPAPQVAEAPTPAKPATVAAEPPVPVAAPPKVAVTTPTPAPAPAAPEPVKAPVVQAAQKPAMQPVRVVSHAAPVRSPSTAEITAKWAKDASAQMDAWNAARKAAPKEGGH